MAQVPVSNLPQVADKHIAHDYIKQTITADALGEPVVKALYSMNNALGNLSFQVEKERDNLAKSKIVELTNQFDNYTTQTLYDKDNGYFYKTGENAMGQSPIVLQNFNDYANDLVSKSGLNGQYKIYAQNALVSRINQLYPHINKYDSEQTVSWQNSVYEDKQNNLINRGIFDRNNDVALSENLRQGYNAIELQSQLQNWGESEKDIKKKTFASNYHTQVIQALISDGSLRAKQYYEQHKNEILPDKQNSILNAVDNVELNYQANALANNLIINSQNEEEALNKAYTIENINLQDTTVQRIKQKYSEKRRMENQAESDALDSFYNIVLNKTAANQPLSYSDIPDNIKPETRLSLMNYINKNGSPDTDDDVWLQLYEMSVNNAQGFAAVNLNSYRGWLSDGEYKNFIKRQEEIKSGTYFTQIKDDDKQINTALKEVGLNPNGDKGRSEYSQIRALTRELEARKGRKITDEELLNITKSLGYKNDDGIALYKQIEKGMGGRVAFTRDVINDYLYYQKKHGELPPDSEKAKIINNRIKNKINEQKSEVEIVLNKVKDNSSVYKNISLVTPKPNEQKVLTYFADVQIPELSKKMGIDIRVTSRYRNQKGSHHAEGRACDIGTNGMTKENKIKLYEELSKMSNTYKFGTSDPILLSHFAGNSKIVDETKYDLANGTNHKNHIHVTLINYNPIQNGNSKVSYANNVYKF